MIFYKVTELSERFEKRLEQLQEQAAGVNMPVQTEIQLWQAHFLLAIAQQVSVVASHLGKIVKKASEPNGQDRNDS